MSAAQRPAGLTKYLSRLGYSVTVLTSATSGSGPIPEAVQTIRTRDLMVSPLNWRRSSFAAIKGESSDMYDETPSVVAAWVIPDLEIIGWIPFALPRALALARRKHFDCVITSSPPQSGHLIGLALQRRGIAWVADLRDRWSVVPAGERSSLSRRGWLDRAMEEAVLSRADGIVGVSPPIAEDLRDRVNPRAVTITNGYDLEATELALSAAGQVRAPSERFTVAYTGTLAFGGASPQPLLDGVRRLQALDPKAAATLELVFAGPMSATDLAQLGAPDLLGTVRVVGALPRGDVLGLQRAADALVLFVDGRHRSGVPGKLYEYLYSGNPILVLGEGSEAARIVDEVGAGVIAPLNDPTSIAETLRRLVRGRQTVPVPAEGALERFSYPRIAAEMAEQVERAIVTRSASM